MSQPLAQLLGLPEPAVAAVVHQLEELSGYTSDDVRLIVDIESAQRERISALGLDPIDTTSRELYHSLLSRFAIDEKHLKEVLGAKGSASTLQALIKAIEKQPFPDQVWVLKKSSAKALLKSVPPKAMMKKIGCRSVESMLKNRDIAELYAGLKSHQSANWFKQYETKITKLGSRDFELRSIEIAIITPSRWKALFGTRQMAPIVTVPSVGAILVSSTILAKRGTALGSGALIVQAINNLRTRSVVLKLRQIQSDFGKLLPGLLFGSLDVPAVLADQNLCWRTVIQACSSANSYPELFEPHVLPDDLQLISGEAVLANIDSKLAFWVGSAAVGTTTSGKAISHNLVDVAANYQSERPYGKRVNGALQRSLWDELIDRYFGYVGVQRKVFEQVEASQPIKNVFSKNILIKPRAKAPNRHQIHVNVVEA